MSTAMEYEVRTKWPRLIALRFALAMCAALMLAACPIGSAHANWLTKLAREAGEAGGGAAKHAGGALDNLGGMARHLKSLPDDPKITVLAAHATPEGHWKFTNRDGEVFTAANADEMSRVVKTLAPSHAGDGRLKLYLSEETVFERPDLVKDLPGSPELNLLAGGRSYRLLADPEARGLPRFVARIKPNLRLRLHDRRLFDEALWQLKRPLSKSGIRVVSLEPGATHTLSAAPRMETGSKAAMIDAIDPWKLPTALSSVKGQTVVVTGRVEGELMHFRPASGAEKSINFEDLKRAAKQNDVNLVVIEAADPRQPGGRNWFWQKVEVQGLDEALGRADFADFLDALGARQGTMLAEARQSLEGRIGFDIRPAAGSGGESAIPMADTLTRWTGEIFSQALGNVATSGIKADLTDKERQEELDSRIIPGIPFIWQALYVAGIVLGLAGLSYVRAWWGRIWPLEERSEYASAFGYHAARTVRLMVMVLLFMPLVGIPAGLWAMLKGTAEQVWFIITLPFRMLAWLWRRVVPQRG